MIDQLTIKLNGVEDLNKRLRDISAMTRGKAARTALRKAARAIADRAKANVARYDDPNTPESIEKNINVSFSNKYFKRTGDLQMRVGVRGGAVSKSKNESNPGGDTFYWRFLEFGTERTAARPFLRPAATEGSQEAVDTFFREFNKSLDRFAKRGIS